jgi:hypothetical protein
MEKEPDTTDMPDLFYDQKDNGDNETQNENNNENNDEDDYEIDTPFDIPLDKTQHQLDDEPQDIDTTALDILKDSTTLAQIAFETDEDTADDTNLDDNDFEQTNQHMNERFKNTERLLDKEVHDIKAINLHTPKIQSNEMQYDEDDMLELMAAQAINNQWQEKREEFEIEWDEKREAMEAEYKETIEAQTSLQTSLVAYETENIREQFKTMQQDIAQARQTLQDISNQNATLKKNTDNKSRQIGHLHTAIGEIKVLKESLKQDTDTLDTLKTTTKNVIDKLKQTTQAAERTQRNITSQVTKAVHETIQGIVNNKMVQVEEAIRHSLLQKGRNIVQQAKTSMQKQQMETTKELEARIADKSNDTYHEAASLLEQAVMRIGEEMDSAIDFRNTLAQP